jgi:hypothetical protein
MVDCETRFRVDYYSFAGAPNCPAMGNIGEHTQADHYQKWHKVLGKL